MNATEQARRSDALYYSGNGGISRRWLCDKVASLERENAELRRELEQWHKLTEGIELPEYPICTFQPKELERENAELRELVRDLLHHVEYPPCEGCLLEMSCAGDLSQCDEYFDWLKPRARKLGVEVDE